MLLGLNLGLPLFVLAVALAQVRLDNWRPDWPARQRAAWRRSLLGCMLVATALTLVITWQKDFRAREERARIAETGQEREEKAPHRAKGNFRGDQGTRRPCRGDRPTSHRRASAE